VAAEAAALLASDDQRPGGHGGDGTGGQGRVVLCTGAKAGEGATTVAVNLALTMARSDAGPVALIDADPNFGDVAFLLRLRAPDPVERRDQQVLSRARAVALAQRHDSGLTVFIPPRVAGQFAMPPTESYVNLIEAAQQTATTVIIDAPFWAVIDHGLHAYADLVVLNTLDDLASLKNAAIATAALGRDEHVRVVVNRVDPEGRGILRRQDGPGEQDIERALGCDVIKRIPELREVDRQGATGDPVVLRCPSGPFADTMRDLAARVARLLEPA
jgi:pilus assembly protein CpaE